MPSGTTGDTLTKLPNRHRQVVKDQNTPARFKIGIAKYL